MSEGTEKARLIAWNRELTAAHHRLRETMRRARRALDAGAAGAASTDVLSHCLAFCSALSGHHASENAALFPELSARYPDLGPTITTLAQDHAMMASLLRALDDGIREAASRGELARHLDGLAAIMESHFRYEERQLLGVLSALELDADPRVLLGPL